MKLLLKFKEQLEMHVSQNVPQITLVQATYQKEQLQKQFVHYKLQQETNIVH
jgi:hypothetical protein